jgi:hypothetical protein
MDTYRERIYDVKASLAGSRSKVNLDEPLRKQRYKRR